MLEKKEIYNLMNRKLEIFKELISIGAIIPEPILIDGEYIFSIDLSHCTDDVKLKVLLDELSKLDG
jgi:uncharacterized spore protein YtfJ